MKKRRLTRILTLLGILVAIAIIAVILMAVFLNQGMADAMNLTIQPVTAIKLADGNYSGGYDSGRWTNQLAVTVKGGRITDIAVQKTVLFEKPEVTQALIQRVIAAQKADVDVISGATATSKAYLKSIESALRGQ